MEREDGQSLHCQFEIVIEAVLAFKAGSEENARMKEAEASRDRGSLETSSRMLAASAHLNRSITKLLTKRVAWNTT